MVNLNLDSGMPLDRSLTELINKRQNGVLNEKDLIAYGKKLSTKGELVKKTIEGVFVSFKSNQAKAEEGKNEFFKNKAISAIKETNKREIHHLIPGIQDSQIDAYLSKLKEGEVLTPASSFWSEISKLHHFSSLQKEIRETKDHWLRDFATPEDLGENLETLNAFGGEGHKDLSWVYRLNKLAPTEPLDLENFTQLLMVFLGSSPLKEMSEEKFYEFQFYLSSMNKLKEQRVDDPLSCTKKIFVLCELMKSLEKEEEKFKTRDFQKYLEGEPDLLKLLTSIDSTHNEQVKDLKNLVLEGKNIPFDLYLSKTFEDILSKYRENTPKAIEKRFGAHFQKIPSKIIDENQNIKSQLKAYEETFRLCGQGKFFLKIMDTAFAGKINSTKELNEAFNKLTNDNKSSIDAMKDLSTRMQEYLKLGIPPEKVENFRIHVTTELNKGKKDASIIDQYAQKFNKKELEIKREEYNQYGADVYEALILPSLLPDVVNGKLHYLSQGLPSVDDLKEREENIQASNAVFAQQEQLRGITFVSALKSYLNKYEPDVLSGKILLSNSEILNRPFDKQVEGLIPFVLPFLKSEFIDADIVRKVMIPKSLDEDPKLFQIRFGNLSRLKESLSNGFAKLKDPGDKRLALEIVRELIGTKSLRNMDKDLGRDLKDPKKLKSLEKTEKTINQSIKKLIKFSKKANESHIYSPRTVAHGLKNLMENLERNRIENSKDKTSHIPIQQLINMSEKCSGVVLLNGKITKEFNRICLKQELNEAAQDFCKVKDHPYDQNIQKLVKEITLKFKNSDKQISQNSLLYLKEVIRLAVDLSIDHSVNANIILMHMKSEEEIIWDLGKIDERHQLKHSGNTKPLIISEGARTSISERIIQGKTGETIAKLVTVAKERPFDIVQAFIPNLIENILPDQEKNVNQIKEALAAMQESFNRSNVAQVGVNIGVRIIESAIEVKQLDTHGKLDLNKIKQSGIDKMTEFNKFSLQESNKAEIEAQLKDKSLERFSSAANFLFDRIKKVHAKAHLKVDTKEDKHLNEVLKTATEVETFDILIREILPKILEQKNTIKNVLMGIGRVSTIPFIGQIGSKLVNTIVNKYLSKKLEGIDSIDDETKKLIQKTIKMLISTGIIVVPALLNNYQGGNNKEHNIEALFTFLENFNQKMQQPDLDENELFLDILTGIQTITQEGLKYVKNLEDAVVQTADQLVS